MEAKAPNPGSDDAIEQGCRCPVMDNAHGHGYLGRGRDMYVYARRLQATPTGISTQLSAKSE